MCVAVLGGLTLLRLVLTGVHISQSDVGVAQLLDPSDHLASLFPELADDPQGHIGALLHHNKETEPMVFPDIFKKKQLQALKT